ncbi:MAG: WD40 repeat domain-containing protein [Gemmataceae bacterium]
MSSTASLPLSLSEPPRVFGVPALHTDGELLALGLTVDGVLYSVQEPGELRSWDLRQRHSTSSVPLEGMAMVWAFNWASRLLASASDEVTVWEAASGKQLSSWAMPTAAWVSALAFQPGEAVLATGHEDGTVRIWDWAAGELRLEIAAHPQTVSAIAFSWDGTRLATAGEDKLIHLWDVTTGQPAGTLTGHKDRIPGLLWHPDNRRLFSAGWDTTVRVWDTTTCEPIILLNSHATQVHALALSADGKLLASADSRSTVHLWDTDRHVTVALLREATGEVRCLAFSPNDDRGNVGPAVLVYGGADRLIYLWDSRQGSGGTGQTDPLVSRTAIALSPDDRTLYGLGAGMPLRGWDVDRGDTTLTLQDSPLLRTAALSPDGRWIAAARVEGSADDRTTLALHRTTDGGRQAVCDGQQPPITALAFDPAGTLLAAGGIRSSDVWLWKVPAGEPALLIPDAVDSASVEGAGVPAGRSAAGGGRNRLAGDQPPRRSNRPVGRSTSASPGCGSTGAVAMAWHPDGSRLLVAGLDRIARVYDAATGQVLHELRGHQDSLTCLAVSPDGQLLVTGGDDRALRVWDVRSGDAIAAWELDNPVRAVAFSHDGRYLYTGNSNTSCYQLELDQLLAGLA